MTSTSRPVPEHDDITTLDVRSRVLDQAEVVTFAVVEAVRRHKRESDVDTKYPPDGDR